MLKLATASLLLLLSSSCDGFRLPVGSQELLQMAQDVEVTLLTVSLHQNQGHCRKKAELTVSLVAGGADLQHLGSTAQQEVQRCWGKGTCCAQGKRAVGHDLPH